MTTQSSPVITDMKVIPVAGHDSMLLNIGGAHNAYFTRNIVVLTDNAGHTGIGEAPGGEVIYQTLVDAIPMVLGQASNARLLPSSVICFISVIGPKPIFLIWKIRRATMSGISCAIRKR